MNSQKKTEFDSEYSLNGDINIVKISISLDKNKCENPKYFEILSKFITTFNQKYDNICSCYDKSPVIKTVLSNELDVFTNLEYYTARVKTLENEVVNLNNKMNNIIPKSDNIEELRSDIIGLLDKYSEPNYKSSVNTKNNGLLFNSTLNAKHNIQNEHTFNRGGAHKSNDISNYYKAGQQYESDSDSIAPIKGIGKLYSGYSSSISDIASPVFDIGSPITPNSNELDYKLLNSISELIPDEADILLKHIVRELNGSARGLSDYVSLFHKYGKEIQSYNQIVYFQRKGCHFVKRVKA
jgi:hypothetical protein